MSCPGSGSGPAPPGRPIEHAFDERPFDAAGGEWVGRHGGIVSRIVYGVNVTDVTPRPRVPSVTKGLCPRSIRGSMGLSRGARSARPEGVTMSNIEQAFEVEAGVREACAIVGVEAYESRVTSDTILVHHDGMVSGLIAQRDDGTFRVETSAIVPDGDSIAEMFDDREGFATYVGAALACLAMVVEAADAAPEHPEPWIRTYFDDQLPA